MAIPLRVTTSTDSVAPNKQVTLYSVTIEPGGNAGSVTIFDGTQAGGTAKFKWPTLANGAGVTYLLRGAQFLSNVSVTLTNATSVTLEVE